MSHEAAAHLSRRAFELDRSASRVKLVWGLLGGLLLGLLSASAAFSASTMFAAVAAMGSKDSAAGVALLGLPFVAIVGAAGFVVGLLACRALVSPWANSLRVQAAAAALQVSAFYTAERIAASVHWSASAQAAESAAGAPQDSAGAEPAPSPGVSGRRIG